MVNVNPKYRVFFISALVSVAASLFCVASCAFGQDSSSLSKWSESSSRKAGTRQTLEIGDVAYGFCWIPAGEFDMGSPESEKGRGGDETLHHVKLTKGFWMLETEVTQALYWEIMESAPSYFKETDDISDLPVENVSWDDATRFCDKLTERLPKGLKASLPTEAQWEYACRAGTTTPFSFGSDLNGDRANCDGNSPYGTFKAGRILGRTTPVKSYGANPWGLYDMHGNVWEWCLDFYGDYPSGTVVDPTGPDNASCRVHRGGSWLSDAGFCRSAVRYRFSAGGRLYDLGFRCLLSCD